MPEKNAAAQRVIGIAKGFRAIGYQVVFLNSLKECCNTEEEKTYFGFRCFEYGREPNSDYLLSAKTTLSMLSRIHPNAVIAYNYPAVALNRIRKYCKTHKIKCFADVTEWYDAAGSSPVAQIIKGLDTCYRMNVVQKKMDGVIAISRYLYDYYKDSGKTVLIPPTVDLDDAKWNIAPKQQEGVSFAYAGVPSAAKERLDKIVNAVTDVAVTKKVTLNIVGITKEQFVQMYSWQADIPDCIVFWGRVEHQKALQIVGQSNWSIILREDSRLVKAGFPTKLVESISCGTAVIANRFSNVYDYLTEENSVCIEDMDNIAYCVLRACDKRCVVDRLLFDYHNYLQELKILVED